MRFLRAGLLVGLVLLMPGCDVVEEKVRRWAGDEVATEVKAPEYLPPEPTQVHGLLPHAEIPKSAPLVGKPGVDQYGYPLARPDRAAFNRLVRARRFDLLDQFIGEFQAAFEKDYRHEYWVGDALAAMEDADPALLPALDHWVEENPQSYAAHAARAHHYAAVGYHFRGGKVAQKTSEKQFSTQKDYMERAIEDLDVALRLEPNFSAAQIAWLRFAKSAGGSTVQLDNLLERALRTCPACFRPHATRLLQLKPRWGGSHAEMEAYARSAQAKVGENPRLSLLLGMPEADRCSALVDFDKDVVAAGPHCEKAVTFGYESIVALPTMDFYRLSKDPERVSEVATKILALEPQNTEALKERMWGHRQAKRYKEAAVDLIVLRQLDSTDEWLGKQAKWITDMLRHQGDLLRKEKKANEAATFFQLGLEISPEDHDLRVRMAYADQEHVEALQKLVAEAPDDYPMHIRADGALAVQKRFPEIIQMWDRYIDRHPDDARAYFERGGAKKHGNRADWGSDAVRACDLGMAEACNVVKRFGLKKAP